MDQPAAPVGMVDAKVLLTPLHACWAAVSARTNVQVVGTWVEGLLHKCREMTKAVTLEPSRPVHWAKAVAHCKRCDTLYVFDNVESWMLLVGADRRGK